MQTTFNFNIFESTSNLNSWENQTNFPCDSKHFFRRKITLLDAVVKEKELGLLTKGILTLKGCYHQVN